MIFWTGLIATLDGGLFLKNDYFDKSFDEIEFESFDVVSLERAEFVFSFDVSIDGMNSLCCVKALTLGMGSTSLISLSVEDFVGKNIIC